MQKSGIKFWELMPRTIVPLDSAFVNLVYTAYFSAFDGFLQVIKLGVCLLDCHANQRLPAMTKCFKVQVLEVVRTQWIPACAGMTVFKFCK